MKKVYVYWYHEAMEGELMEEEFLGMKQVRLELDGHKVVTLFSAGHIFSTPAEAEVYGRRPPVKHQIKPCDYLETIEPAKVEAMKCEVPLTPDECMDFAPVSLASWQKIKDQQWDHEHNHLKIEALEEFYKLWVESHGGMVMVDLGKEGGDKTVVSQVYVPETEPVPMQAILPIKPAPPPVRTKEPVKLTKKEKLSTGTIQYNDSLQTSIFDLL